MGWFSKKKSAKEIVDEERKQINNEIRVEVLKKMYPNGNYKGNIYAERLIQEWLDHGKIVLAGDWDDTINPWKFKGYEANTSLIRTHNVIKLAQSVGCYFSVWTACDAKRFDEIKERCENYGIRVDSINENPIPLPYGNHRKMYYNHLLDDRAGLEQAVDILEYVCYRVLSDRKPQTKNFDV